MSIPNIGIAEVIGIIILALAIVGFLKGVMRTVMALACLGLAGYAAFWGNEHAHELTASWGNLPSVWAPKIIATITGVVVFIICKRVLNFLVDPFNNSEAGKRFGFGLPAAAMSLCAGLVLIWLAFTGVRYAASISELRDTQKLIQLDANSAAEQTSLLILRAQRALDESNIGAWQRKTDPLYSAGKLELSKLLVMYYDEPTRIKLLKNSEVSKFLNRPEFIDLAYSDDVKSYAQSNQPREIFNAPSLQKALNNSELMLELSNLDIEGN